MKYTPYRRTLAWIGFITLFIAIPAALVIGIRYISTLGTLYYDRDMYCAEARENCDPFYQQTKQSFSISTTAIERSIAEIGILHDPE